MKIFTADTAGAVGAQIGVRKPNLFFAAMAASSVVNFHLRDL